MPSEHVSDKEVFKEKENEKGHFYIKIKKSQQKLLGQVIRKEYLGKCDTPRIY